MTSIVEVIQHYQRSIDSSQDNEARLLHCINKLYKLPIKVEHLQETGVGKTVNSLRKFNGEIGIAAKTLVTKWKAMVAAEEEPMDTSQTNDSETHDNNNDDVGATPQDNEDDENHNLHNTSPQEQNKHFGKDKDKHKERQKELISSSNGQKESKHSSSHHDSVKSSKNSADKLKSTSASSKDKGSHHKNSSSSSSIKDKERQKEKTEHKNSKDKHKDNDHDKDRDRSERRKEDKHKDDKDIKIESSSSHHKSSSSSTSKSKHDDKHQSSSKEKDKERSEKHKSSSKDKDRTKEEKPPSKDKSEHHKSSSASSSKSSTKDSTETAERKRRHNSDNESIDFKSPQPKLAKVQKSSSSAASSSKPENSPPQAAEEEEVADDSFDSSMGTNFNDILGMLDVPKKKNKKSLKSPSISTNSSSSKKETTPNRPSTSSGSSNNTPTKVNGMRTPFASSSSSYSAASTSKATLRPDLLAPTAKLEPLDPSIALELPSISTNYKPMPLNQTVMDCVFNYSSSSSNSKPTRTLTDSEAITHGISSKTMRTKIYSGVRTGQTFQVPTLFDMCIRILQKNIDALEYTGGVPFEVLRPVLDRASPQQLYNFEEYNPYLMEDSDLLWQVHVSRNYRIKKRQENESWREMYMRCQEEEEEKLSMLKNNIKASQKIAAAPVRKTQLAFVDTLVKPPRNVQRKQEQYGTKSKMVATPASRVASLQSVTPNAAKTGDQRLKVPVTVRDPVHVNPVVRNKKAPLMQKTLQFIRGRLKR